MNALIGIAITLVGFFAVVFVLTAMFVGTVKLLYRIFS